MKKTEMNRILVANRGEIAGRIIRAIQLMGKQALAVYAEDDRDLPFVEEADEAYGLGSGPLSGTYLDGNLLLRIAQEARADAIHPGYGFLSENAAFAALCEKSGLSFIGPPSGVISMMGNKSAAREKAAALGLPVLEGERGELDTLVQKRSKFAYPLLVKAAAGGGGKGMRVVRTEEALEEEALAASREAMNYFGSGELYVERFLEGARHVEVQVIADRHGNSVHLFERECSLQRRYQKIVEESPSLFLSEVTRSRITSAALELVRGIGYINAGTVEFLVDKEQNFYFMEMNTRIQVEHPVTEEITGIDLVREQIRVAEGTPLSFQQEEIRMEGHSMEVRLYAEDPMNDFIPHPGTLTHFELPAGGGIRIEKGYRAGNRVSSSYDPMLAKLIVKGMDREEARLNMLGALKRTHPVGTETNRDFLVALLQSEAFRLDRVHTGFLDQEMQEMQSGMAERKASVDRDLLLSAAAYISLSPVGPDAGPSPWQQIGHWRLLPAIQLICDRGSHLVSYARDAAAGMLRLRLAEREYRVSQISRKGDFFRLLINGKTLEVWGVRDQSEIHLDVDGQRFSCRRGDIPDRRYIPAGSRSTGPGQGELTAPMNGRVLQIPVKEGDRVEPGSALMVIESMKMENKILSDHRAVVSEIGVREGQQVRTNQILMTLVSL